MNRKPRTRQELLDELADLEWRLDPENSDPDPDVDWVIQRKTRVLDQLSELEAVAA